MKVTLSSVCGVLVVALLTSVGAQSDTEATVSGEVVLATDAGVYVAAVGSPFRIVAGTRLLATRHFYCSTPSIAVAAGHCRPSSARMVTFS